VWAVPQSESRDNFIPTDHERRVLLELIQSPQESLESIAHELKITLAALTIYLATDDAASLFAQADLGRWYHPVPPLAALSEWCALTAPPPQTPRVPIHTWWHNAAVARTNPSLRPQSSPATPPTR
jgi:hypothetical protein